jgi:hypothetical protein
MAGQEKEGMQGWYGARFEPNYRIKMDFFPLTSALLNTSITVLSNPIATWLFALSDPLLPL